MNKAELVYKTGLYKIFKPFYSGMGHVLMFHRVGQNDEQVYTRDLMVSPDFLETTLNYFISRNIDVVSLDECHRRLSSRKREKRFVTFTFDDGYEDNLSQALPVFEKYEAPFSVFLTTGFPDHRIVLWWYLLENLVLSRDQIEFSDGDQSHSFPSSTEREKKEAFWGIRRHIMQSSQEELLPRLMNIFNTDEKGLLEHTRTQALTWEQVSELGKHPLATIGSHTMNHLALSQLSEEKVLGEIQGANERILEKTGLLMEYLAYPFGIASTVGPREFELAARCRMKMAFTTESSNLLKRHARNMYALPRIEMTEGWDDQFFDLYMKGFTPFVHRLVR